MCNSLADYFHILTQEEYFCSPVNLFCTTGLSGGFVLQMNKQQVALLLNSKDDGRNYIINACMDYLCRLRPFYRGSLRTVTV